MITLLDVIAPPEPVIETKSFAALIVVAIVIIAICACVVAVAIKRKKNASSKEQETPFEPAVAFGAAKEEESKEGE